MVTHVGVSGIKVDASWTYNASFYYKFVSPYANATSVNATVDLRSAAGVSFAATPVELSVSSNWTRAFLQLTPSASTPSTANNFTLTLDGADVQGTTLHLAMLSLFPPTYKGRANGMRADVAETLAAAKPSFFRLPGGNNLVRGRLLCAIQSVMLMGMCDAGGRDGVDALEVE